MSLLFSSDFAINEREQALGSRREAAWHHFSPSSNFFHRGNPGQINKLPQCNWLSPVCPHSWWHSQRGNQSHINIFILNSKDMWVWPGDCVKEVLFQLFSIFFVVLRCYYWCKIQQCQHCEEMLIVWSFGDGRFTWVTWHAIENYKLVTTLFVGDIFYFIFIDLTTSIVHSLKNVLLSSNPHEV